MEQTDAVLTDAILIEHVQAGDQEALADLMGRYRQLVYRVAYRITRNHEDASDVFQETFLRVARSIDKFRQESSFQTWLYRIVVRLSLNAVKRAERRRKRHEAAASERSLISGDDPHRQVEAMELEEQVRQAIEKLAPHHRSVVVLHDLEGLSHAEVAQILECSVGTVRSRIHHARKRLRTLLRAYVEASDAETSGFEG